MHCIRFKSFCKNSWESTCWHLLIALSEHFLSLQKCSSPMPGNELGGGWQDVRNWSRLSGQACAVLSACWALSQSKTKFSTYKTLLGYSYMGYLMIIFIRQTLISHICTISGFSDYKFIQVKMTKQPKWCHRKSGKLQILFKTACRAMIFLLYFTLSRNFPSKLSLCFKGGGWCLFPNRLACLHAWKGSGPLLTRFGMAQPTPVKPCLYPFIPAWCRNAEPTCLRAQKVKIRFWKRENKQYQ